MQARRWNQRSDAHQSHPILFHPYVDTKYHKLQLEER